MAVKGAELESELIDTVCERVRERLPAEQAMPCEAFVRQYYQWVPAEDLADRNPLDLYGAAVAHWNLAQHRAPGEAKVRVYNPEFEQHGWQSPHTRDRDRLRRHAVHRRLGDDGPHAQGLRDRPGHPPGDADPARRATARSLEVLEPDSDNNDAIPESILHAEVGREHDRRLARRAAPEHRKGPRPGPRRGRGLAGDARRAERPGRGARRDPPPVDPATAEETKAFLALAGRRQLHLPRLSRLRPDRGRRRHASSRPSTAPGWGSSEKPPARHPRSSARRRSGSAASRRSWC